MMKKVDFVHHVFAHGKDPRGDQSETACSPEKAVELALSYVGIPRNEVIHCEHICADDFCEVRFSTAWLNYDFYVDCITGEVTGCNFEPAIA